MSDSRKAVLKELAIEQLVRGAYQPREQFDEVGLDELAQSIRSTGLLQPLVVRPLKDNQYEIIAGERRWRAAQRAGLTQLSCLVNNFTDDQAAEATTIENVIRVDLNPVEEAKAYQRLIDEFGYIHDEVAAAIGKSRTKITNTLRLLKLSPEIQAYLIEGRISEGHGKILAGLPLILQSDLAKKCVARGWSIKKLDQEVKRMANGPSSVKADPNLKSLEKSLSEHVGTRASIQFDDGRGELTLDFQNLDVLEGLLAKLGYSKD